MLVDTVRCRGGQLWRVPTEVRFLGAILEVVGPAHHGDCCVTVEPRCERSAACADVTIKHFGRVPAEGFTCRRENLRPLEDPDAVRDAEREEVL